MGSLCQSWCSWAASQTSPAAKIAPTCPFAVGRPSLVRLEQHFEFGPKFFCLIFESLFSLIWIWPGVHLKKGIFLLSSHFGLRCESAFLSIRLVRFEVWSWASCLFALDDPHLRIKSLWPHWTIHPLGRALSQVKAFKVCWPKWETFNYCRRITKRMRCSLSLVF